MTHEQKLQKAKDFMDGVRALEDQLGVTLRIVSTATEIGAYIEVEDESIQLEELAH